MHPPAIGFYTLTLTLCGGIVLSFIWLHWNDSTYHLRSTHFPFFVWLRTFVPFFRFISSSQMNVTNRFCPKNATKSQLKREATKLLKKLFSATVQIFASIHFRRLDSSEIPFIDSTTKKWISFALLPFHFDWLSAKKLNSNVSFLHLHQCDQPKYYLIVINMKPKQKKWTDGNRASVIKMRYQSKCGYGFYV